MYKWLSIKRNKKGFTLVELIVVVAILGILATIAIPRLTGVQDRAKLSADKVTFATLNSAIAVAVEEGRIISNFIVEIESDGMIKADISKTNGGKTDSNTIESILESGAMLQISDNIKIGRLTWVVEEGAITESPIISNDGKISSKTILVK